MKDNKPLGKLLSAIFVAGVLLTVAIIPFAGAGGWMVNSSVSTMNSNVQDISENSSVPRTTTVTDRNGKPIAWLYDQRRFKVPSEKISQDMKDSIVGIEDRRFYQHKGVDVRGTFRAIMANLSSGGVSEGASTLDQQYVKNYLYLISADNDQERKAAVETSAARKLREMKMAGELDRKFSKDEILTRYLNLIAFGHGAYGIESAARTYFGTHASDLNESQSALLAGMVQSTSTLDPWQNPDGAMQRRNQVLQSRVTAGSLTQAQADAAKQEPLGIRDTPGGEPNGCIGAGDSGFFCDYALQWLDKQGFDSKKLAKGGYTIKTSLDPNAQQIAEQKAQQYVDPSAEGVAQATNFIAPTKDSHEVIAMASSRKYGLDKGQTVLPITHSLQGHGAGSIFKLFATGAALEDGLGLDNIVGVPKRVELDGLGHGGAEGCPATKYCVENAADYKPAMSVRDALANSPNTPFMNMEEKVGVARTVDMAVKLGLRSYGEKGSFDADTSLADHVKEANMGSFVLGPTAVNPLELSNVGATLADNGRWCEPSPVLSMKDPDGKDVPLKRQKCEQVVDKGVANALANGMSGDVTSGTASEAAHTIGWTGDLSSKTGTTETSFSSSFLGFTPGLAGSSYIFNDGGTPANLCTAPVRQCGKGDLYGGKEPAQTFLSIAQQIVGDYGGPGVPAVDPKYLRGNGSFEGLGGIPAPTSGRGSSRGGNPGAGQSPALPSPEQFGRDLGNLLNQFLGR